MLPRFNKKKKASKSHFPYPNHSNLEAWSRRRNILWTFMASNVCGWFLLVCKLWVLFPSSISFDQSLVLKWFPSELFTWTVRRSAYLKEKSKTQTQKVAKGHTAEKGLSWSPPSLPAVFTQSFLSQLPNLCNNYHKRTASKSSLQLCFPLSQVIWTQKNSCPQMILTEAAVPEKVTPVSKRLSVCPLRAGKLISIRMSCLRTVFISQWLLKKWGPWVGRA